MRAFPCLYLAFFLSTATATQPSADSEEEPAFGSQFRKMATKYAPVSSQDNHLAPSANLVDRQHRQTKEQISTSQLSSFDVEDPDRDSYLSHDYQLANGDRPQSSSTGKEYDPANPHSEPTSSSKRSLASTLYNNWFWEMTLLFVSTMALAAVVLLLYYWDKKPLSQWPSPISLNTLVSTLGTIHKSGLALFIGACLGQQKWNWFSQHADTLKVLETFDGASRGPLGSTRLVYQLLPRWNWSSLACFVLTISLAFDTFLQATISLAGSIERTTDLYTVPSIGRSTHVGVGSLLQFINPGEFRVAEENYTMETDIFIAYPSMGLLSAIFNGLDNSSAGQQDKVGFSCKTGNCTWPVFASAAVCGSCNDVSKHIFKSSGYGHQSSQPPMDAVIIDGNYTSFNVSYSSIKNANGRRSSPFNPQTSTGDQTDAILTVNATTDYLQSLTYQDANTTFLTFLIMEVDPNWANASVAWEDSTVKATECGLSLCVNAYNSSAQNGSLIEEKVASWHNREPDSWRLTDGYDATYEWWDETYPSLSNEFSLFRSDLQLSIPPNLTQGLNINTTERFNVTQGTIASIQSWILTWGFGAPQSGDIAGLPNLIVYPINADNPYTLAEVLYDSNDLNATFAGLSSSITSYIRDSSSTTVPGDTHEYVIRFRVRWAFFAVPALHILGGITYVFAILWQTKDSGLPVWKNSLIPSLAYGLDTAAQDILRSPHGHLDLASEAVRSKMMVAFDTRDVRLQLRLSEPAGYDGK